MFAIFIDFMNIATQTLHSLDLIYLTNVCNIHWFHEYCNPDITFSWLNLSHLCFAIFIDFMNIANQTLHLTYVCNIHWFHEYCKPNITFSWLNLSHLCFAIFTDFMNIATQTLHSLDLIYLTNIVQYSLISWILQT